MVWAFHNAQHPWGGVGEACACVTTGPPPRARGRSAPSQTPLHPPSFWLLYLSSLAWINPGPASFLLHLQPPKLQEDADTNCLVPEPWIHPAACPKFCSHHLLALHSPLPFACNGG